ncbi:MAG TPA: hypothetical protein VK472_01705 [Allosphingosinicella sp.]|nr:hypothetical protein [Allosphingosinicella sp.]
MNMNTLQVAAESSWLIHAGAALILWAHIAAGTTGIISGTFALAFRKGSPRHLLAGRIFTVSMLAMASIGAAVAPFLLSGRGDPKLFDAIGGLAVLYLVATGWMTVRRKAGTIGTFERIACLAGLLLAAGTFSLGIAAQMSADGFVGGSGPRGFYFQGSIFALGAAFDLRLVRKGGIRGAPRIARHVWRIGLALLVAFISFFLGLQRVMPVFIQGSPLLFIPPLAAFAFIAFWLVKLRFGKQLRALAALGRQPTAPPIPQLAPDPAE